MAVPFIDLTRNLSPYMIPVAWFVTVLPHFYARMLSPLDNKNPRTFLSDASANQTISKETKQIILRAEGAHQNGFENLGLFAAAVVMGNVAKLDNATLNSLSLYWISSRLFYMLLYINGLNDSLAAMRSVVYFAGLGIIFTLFIMSGNALNDQHRYLYTSLG